MLFYFDTTNAELFSQQITQIQDREKILSIKNALGNAKNLYNLIRLLGHFDLLEKVDFKKLSQLYRETDNHLALLNMQEALKNDIDNTNLLNIALEDIVFHFTKVSEGELVLADQLKDTLQKTRDTLSNNFDQQDPEFISLYEELKRLFKKKNMDEVTQDGMKQNIGALSEIYRKIRELNHKNDLLRAKYDNDSKFVRVHKRVLEAGTLSQKESQIFEALNSVKQEADIQVLQNTKLLDNENYFNLEMMRLVINQLKNKNKINLNAESAKYINNLIVNEYVREYQGYTR